jgi:hypothetical protein
MGRARVAYLLLALFLLWVAAGCSGAQQGRDKEGSATTASSPTTSPVIFHRLGYIFSAPSGWYAQEGYLDWEDWAAPPHRGTPPFDTFTSPDEGDPWILVGKRPLRSNQTLGQWIKHLVATKAITYPADECRPVEHERATTLGKEPARMRAFHCPVDGPKAAAAQVLATHKNEGWIVMCYSEEGKVGPLPALEQQCERWLSTFRFLN